MPQDVPHASWPELVGDDMLQGNGLMIGEGDWSLCAGATISDDKMNWSAVAAGDGCTTGITGASAFISNTRYLYSFDLSDHLAGAASIALGDEVGAAWGGNGTGLSEVMLAAEPMGDGFRIFNSSGAAATLSLDNVSVKSFQQLGRAVDWACGADISFNTPGPRGVLTFDAPALGEKAELTGGAKTTFDAAVSNLTAFTCVLHGGGTVDGTMSGTVQVVAKGGDPVDFTFTGTNDETVTHTVTSGSGSGFEIIAGSGASGNITLVRIPGLA